jgi:hypothetical protein
MADTPRTYKRKKDDVTLLAGRLNVEAVMAAQAQSQENRGYHAGEVCQRACPSLASKHAPVSLAATGDRHHTPSCAVAALPATFTTLWGSAPG